MSPFYTRNSTEWDTDLLFKKPWTISSKAEFMLGVGPQWVYLRQNGKTTNSVAGEVAADFMFCQHHIAPYWSAGSRIERRQLAAPDCISGEDRVLRLTPGRRHNSRNKRRP